MSIKIIKKTHIEYRKHGKLHRVDGPAIITNYGGVEYWVNGHLHRDDGPAVDHCDGYLLWFNNGVRHREDGPAVEITPMILPH